MNFHLPGRTKQIISAALCSALLFSSGASVLAFDGDSLASDVFEAVVAAADQNAASSGTDLSQSGYALKRLGIIAGDENGNLLLESTGTRAQALTIFLALQGEQSEANAAAYSYTFQDIPSWFAACCGYSVYKSYASGYNRTTFGSNDAVTPEQYMTFILRALGYSTDGDFVWSESIDKAVSIGLCTREQAEQWESGSFRRQEIMEISYLALNTKLKDSECTLTDKLIAKGKLTEEQAKEENLVYGAEYTSDDSDAMFSDVAWAWQNDGTYELYNVGTEQVMTASSASSQTAVTLAKRSAGVKQQFVLKNNHDGGSFTLANAGNTSLAVDTSPLTGANAILWKKNGTTCQNFAAVEESDGVYSIRLAHNTNMALTAEDGKLVLAAYTGSGTQLWKLNAPAVSQDDTATAAAKLASIMTVHPSGQKLGSSYSFAGAKQCMGFGREVFYRMYGQTAHWNYDGSPKSSSDATLYSVTASSSSYSASSIKSLISKAKPGDVLQMNTPKMHTMIFVSSDANGFTVYDANWVASNTVSVRYVKYSAWSGRNSSGITLLHATNYPKT